jgi:hypothetical protein
MKMPDYQEQNYNLIWKQFRRREDGCGMFIWSVGSRIQYSTASQPKKPVNQVVLCLCGGETFTSVKQLILCVYKRSFLFKEKTANFSGWFQDEICQCTLVIRNSAEWAVSKKGPRKEVYETALLLLSSCMYSEWITKCSRSINTLFHTFHEALVESSVMSHCKCEIDSYIQSPVLWWFVELLLRVLCETWRTVIMNCIKERVVVVYKF